MRILLDLNVLLDVLQRREPHYTASATVLSFIAQGRVEGVIAAHALTTTFYILEKSLDKKKADAAIDWILAELDVASTNRTDFLRARNLGMPDFEDAVTVTAAERARCERIVTRNLKDFEVSPVPAVSPQEFLLEILGGL